MAEAQPDPRAEQVNQLWDCVLQVVKEEGWPVQLERRQDLLLATEWMPAGDARQRRVRFSVVVAAMGVGINVTLDYQQRIPGDETAPWSEVTDPELLAQKRMEEMALARRIQLMWQRDRR